MPCGPTLKGVGTSKFLLIIAAQCHPPYSQADPSPKNGARFSEKNAHREHSLKNHNFLPSKPC